MRYIVALLAAFGAVFCLAGPAEAGPVAGFFAAVKTFAAASAINAAIVQIVGSIAMSALSMAITGKMRSGGIQTDATQEGGTNSQSVIVGTYATAGSRFAPRMTWSKSHREMFDVIALCDVPVTAISRVMVNGEYVDLIPDVTSEGLLYDYGAAADTTYEGRLNLDLFDGSQTQASAKLLDKFGGAELERRWQSDMIGRGMAYVLLRYRFSASIYNGWPEAVFEVRGIKLYDPRKDSSVGGSGGHRWGNRATWEWSDNPIVIIYNILRGIMLPDGRVWGGEAVAEDLPLAVWAAAMSVCDVQVNIAGGGTEARYRCGFEIKVAEEEPADVIEEILKSCGGSIVEMGGTYHVRAGGPGLPVYFFSDDDLLVTSGHEFDPFPGLAETVNTLNATYPEPGSAWQSHDAPEYSVADYVTQDQGRILPQAVTLPAVPHRRQVQRLMRAWLKDSRRWRRHTIALGHWASGVMPLDTVAWTSERNGYTEKHFEVAQVVETATLVQQWEIREVDPTDYDWSSDFEVPVYVPSVLPDLPVYEPVPGWSVAPTSIKDGSGRARRPALRFGWHEQDISARSIRIQIRVKGQPDTVQAITVTDLDAGGVAYGEGILPATNYQARARLNQDGPTQWTAWEEVVTPDTRLTGDDVDWTVLRDELEEELNQAVDDLTDWINGEGGIEWVDNRLKELQGSVSRVIDDTQASAGRYRELLNQVEAIRDYATQIDYSQWAMREELRRQVSLLSGVNLASFDERINVAVSATGALAERITLAEAETAAVQASLTEVETAMVEGDTALAQQMAALAVGTQTQFDHVGIWYFDAGVDGWTGSPAAPTVVSGYLRPPTGSGAYVISPAGLAVAAATYSQVRLRVRRVGAPTWAGYLYWAASGQAWDNSRRIAIPEPSWVDGIGLITVSPAWTGSIDKIRLDLASAPTGAAYIEIDWASIGRPAPGATSAALASERSARIGADEAMALDLASVRADLTDLEGAQSGTAGALEALEGRVEETEDGLAATATALTAVNAGLAGKASTEALSALEALVQDVSGGLVAETVAVTTLRNTLLPVALASVDQGFADFLARQGVREAQAGADQVLRTNIAQTETGIAILAEAVLKVTAALPGLASAEAVSSLTSRVAISEGKITAQAEALTSVDATVGAFSAGGRFRATVEATPSGATARIGLSVAASAGAATQTAALFLEATSGGVNRVLVEADTFAIRNGGSRTFPFILEGGIVFMENVKIRYLDSVVQQIGVLRSGPADKERLEIRDNRIMVFDENNVVRVRIGAL